MSEENWGFTRRRLLGAAAASGAAMGLLALPPNLRRALAAEPPGTQPSLGDIKHVVLLMQENRSFDHYFGTMSGVKGFSDPDAMMLSTGRNVFHQPTDTLPDGYMLPFHLDTRTTSAQKVPATGHGWDVLHACWNGGKMDSFLTGHYMYDGNKQNVPYCMGYYEEQDLPFHRALADAFTICDRYHCSMLGSTAPNRLYWETGTIDPYGIASGPILSNEVTVRTWRTYAENLTEAGVSWKCYHVPNGMESSLNYFRAYHEAPIHSPLHLNLQQGPLDQFEQDAINDRLPTVSWLFAPRTHNEHPNQSTPALGAQFIASRIDAIAANPDVWAKTVFILVYDENDGFFDHVPPPTPPAGTVGEYPTKRSPTGIDPAGLPIGAGFRVPCIIVSPWTAGGWVCSEPFDHTSNLRFLERVTGVEAPNITSWRRQTFGDMTSALRFGDRPVGPPTLRGTTEADALVQRGTDALPSPVFPTMNQIAPTQQDGRRPTFPSSKSGA